MDELGPGPRPDPAEVPPQVASVDGLVSDGHALHVCPSCRYELVHPTEWSEAGPTHWSVSLRCPNCEWRGSGLFEQRDVERFDDALDCGTAALTRDLRQLARANMEEEVERFTRALHTGHVLPEDF